MTQIDVRQKWPLIFHRITATLGLRAPSVGESTLTARANAPTRANTCAPRLSAVCASLYQGGRGQRSMAALPARDSAFSFHAAASPS